ncbi:MAG: hypothetical protein WC607_01140 [Candidatus Micrarchaeia archaeon]
MNKSFLSPDDTSSQQWLRETYPFVFVKRNGNLMFTNKEHGFKLLGLKMGRKRERTG